MKPSGDEVQQLKREVVSRLDRMVRKNTPPPEREELAAAIRSRVTELENALNRRATIAAAAHQTST